MAALSSSMSVAVVLGPGGIGAGIARRIATGRHLVLADRSPEVLDATTALLKSEGFTVYPHIVDICDAASVAKLASDAAALGRLDTVVNVAGLTPTCGDGAKIIQVDMVGTAIILEAFLPHLAPGASMVCIASMSGRTTALTKMFTPDVEAHVARAPVTELLNHPIVQQCSVNPGFAYGFAKCANILRVQAAARAYGAKGCRVNSISPGVIMTRTLELELADETGKIIEDLVRDAPISRYGSPGDVANAVAFLVGHDSSFITGTDLLVDGGSVAAQTWGSVG